MLSSLACGLYYQIPQLRGKAASFGVTVRSTGFGGGLIGVSASMIPLGSHGLRCQAGKLSSQVTALQLGATLTDRTLLASPVLTAYFQAQS